MAKQTINLGSAPDDGAGDTLRVGGDKINDNFDELYAADGDFETRVSALEGASGVSVLDDLTDVNAPTPADGDVLTWDNGAGEWQPAAPAGGGGGGGDLLAANNLSDLANAGTARTNLSVYSKSEVDGFIAGAVSSQTGTSYTAVLGDANTYIRFSNAGSITFTIPPNSSVAFPVGTRIEMEQAGAGALTVAPGSGVTVNSRGSDLTLAGQYAMAVAKKVATDTWIVSGDL